MIPIYLLRKLRYASEYYRKFSSEILKEKEIEKRRERIKKLKEHLEKKRAFVQTKKKVEKEKKEEQKVIKAEKVEIKEAKIEMPPMPQVVPTRAAVSEEKVESVSTKEKEETKEPKISIKVLPPPEPSKEKAAVPKEVTILAAPVAPTYIPPFLEEGGLRLKVKEAMKLPETMRKEEKKIKFDITKVDDRYPLVKVEFEGEERDMAYAHITWVEKEHKLKYFVEEPTLSEEEKKIFNRVVGYLREKIEVDFARIRKKEVYEILKNNFVKVLKIIKKNVTKDEIFKYLYFLKRNILGLGKIEPLMHDPYIEDISCLPSFEKVLIVDFREGIAQFLTIPEIIEKYREDLRIVKATKKYVMFTFENRELYTLSFDLKNKKVTFDKIKYIIIKKNIPKKIVRIKLEKGLQISVTPDHKVLVYDKNKNKILFKYAGDIREGDILVGINKGEINFEENTIEYINLIDVFNKGKENIGEERYKKIRVLGWTKVMKNLDIINKVAKDLNIPKYNIYNWIKSDSIPLYVYSYMRERYSKFMKKENEKNLYLAYNSGYKNKIKAVIDNLKDLAFILGLYIAEGWVNENGILFSFNKREKVLIAELVNKVKKCFGNVTISIKASRIWNSVTVYVGGVLLKLLFIDVWKLGKDSYSKRMPSFIFKTNKKVKLELIGAYILGDGYINSEKAKISIITASSKLVDDLTLLFLEFGIILPAYKRNDKFGRGFEINILGEDAKKLMNLLKWKINMRNTGTNRVYLIPKELVINSPYAQLLTATQKKILRKISYKTSYLSNKIKEIFTPNLNFFRVKEIQIEEYKEKYVYDITTEKYHNFLHRGLIFSHNCDGVGIPIFVYHKKPMYGQLETNIVFNTKEELDSFVYKLAQICGKSISLAKPLLDGVLPDGSRVQATLGSDIARRGSNFCIKDGYVQLASGIIVKIDKLFEMLANKSNVKKDEYGNEYIDKEFYVVGVDPMTLKQTKLKVKRIYKMKPPKELVKIYYREAGKTIDFIEVTKNHCIHVIRNGKIEIIEAKDLKPGDYIITPSKISVDIGEDVNKIYRKKLFEAFDLYSRERGLYVYIPEEIFPIVAKYVNCKDFRRRKTKAIKWELFKDILQRENLKIDKLYLICRDGRKGRGNRIVIPLKWDEKYAYFVGWIVGDGHIDKNKVDIAVYNRKKVVRLKKVIKYLFEIEPRIYYSGNRVYINSSILAFILNHVFEVPFNRKRDLHIPKIVQRSSKEIIKHFIRGLWEADGHIRKDFALLAFSSKSKALIEELRYLLLRYGVFSKIYQSKDTAKLIIYGIYRDKFLKEFFGIEYNTLKNKKVRVMPTEMVTDNPYLIRNRKNIGYTTALKYKHLLKSELISGLIELLEKEGLELVKVEKVEIVKNKSPVYDIECEPYNFYLGGKIPMFIHDTIRKFTYRPLSPTDLMLNGTASEVVFAYLWLLIENNFSVLIAGATATGKTTFLNAVSLFIRPDAKIISIEDTPELRLPHENWVPEVERAPVGGESYGAVTMYDLLKAALRKRPDYIIVGEVRGKEANVLFHGMETGHPALGTIHADNFDALVDRLTSPPINLATQRLQSLDAVVFMTRFRLGRQYVRRVREIVEIIGYDRGRKRVKTNVAFEWDHTTDTFIPRKSFLLERVRELMNMKPEEFKKEFYRRVKLLRWLKEKKIVDYVEFSKYIRRYYLDPTFVDKLKI